MVTTVPSPRSDTTTRTVPLGGVNLTALWIRFSKIWWSLGLRAVDLEDDGGLLRPHGGGTRLPLEEGHLAEDLALPHDRQGKFRASAHREERLGGPGTDHEDRVADRTLAQDHLVAAEDPLGRG